MSLQARIEADLKDAMRAKDVVRRDTLRMLLAALKNKRIETGQDLDEAAERGVLATAAKTRAESVEQYEQGGRPELAEKERAEIEVIQGYLPKQLDEAETYALVEAKIAELGLSSKQDIGKLMKAIMAEHRGAVDGKLVQRQAGELLG